MIQRLTAILYIVAASVTWAQELPDFTDPDVPPPIVGDLDGRPKLAIELSDDGKISIDGVAFTDDQIAVVFRLIAASAPKTVILFRANPVAIKHSRRVIRIASEEGITDAIFSLSKETKTGEQDGAGQPATAPESKPEGEDKPQPESEVRPQ